MQMLLNNALHIIVQALQLLIGLSLLVVIHEFGHYCFARLFGIRVDKFYMFFDVGGKALWRFKPKGSSTEFGIGWLPLGGYCKIAGMIDESLDIEGAKREPQPDEFRSKPAWQRFLVMFGGVLFNLIFAFVIYTAISYHWGEMRLSSRSVTEGMIFSPAAQAVGFQDNDIIWSVEGEELNALNSQFMRSVIDANEVQVMRGGELVTITMPSDMMNRIIADGSGLMSMQIPFVVDSVLPGSMAEQAGWVKGDQLTHINGIEVHDISDARYQMAINKAQPIQATLLRQDSTVASTITPDSMGHVGIMLSPITTVYDTERVDYSLLQSVPVGLRKAKEMLSGYTSDMKYVFTKEGAGQVGGFISIGNLFPKQFSWFQFWTIIAIISIILAVMNILPIPGLDGGHIMFLLWEIITRRKVSTQVMVYAQMIGMLLLILLAIYANMNDIIKLF